MEPLSASAMVRLYEWGEQRHAVDRALGILKAALPAWSQDALADLAVGRRDGFLLEVRAATFGQRLAVSSACPRCEEALEFEVSVADLVLRDPHEPLPAPDPLVVGDVQVTFRLLTSRDLMAVAAVPDPAEARRRLILRSVMEVRDRDRGELLPASLAPGVLEALAAAQTRADPQSEIQFTLSCPACSHDWLSVLDVVGEVWAGITHRVRELAEQVHVLAGAYGWSERDILAMSDARRRRYLDLIGTS